jgi:hypothetical protein
MKIIGFNLTKVSVNRKEKFEGKLEINQNIDIKNVVKDSIPITDEEVLKIDFYFQINYSPDFAKLEFEGNILLIPEKEELKSILKSWKDKKIPDETRVPLFNFIMSKCNIKALLLEDEMSLPYHIPMPRINFSDKEKDKA